MKVVIIGGVAGGMSAATRLRRLREDAEIIVYEKGQDVSFANCGLPYFIGGVIDKKESLLLQTPESLWKRFRLDVRVHSEVVGIDREKKTITATNAQGESEIEEYDYIIISPGANPRKLPIEGIERAVVLKDVEDSVRIKELVDANKVQSAAILGAGFIGVELAENLAHRGIKTTLVEFRDHVLPQFDIEMIEPFQAHLNENGIEIAVGAETEKIDDRSLTLKDGRVIDADLVVSSVGVVAESKLAELAGLEMGDTGGIKVDENLRTSDPNIFAVGDAVEKRSLVTNQQQMIWLANLANRHGRLVADAIAGEAEAARKSIGTGIIGAFGMAAALTGITEGLAQRLKISYRAIHLHPSSHAGYFPGAERISLKVLFDPSDGKLLGAQAVGKDGADKRVDIIATAIYAGLTINDLMNLELAYSPQYGSAKDAVNHAGYVGNNVLSEKSQNVHWNQLPEEVGRGVKILDVRTQSEFDRGHIPGAILAPVDELRDKLDELEGHEYIVHCAVGQRAHTAIQILKNKGIEARNLSGGYTTWKFAQDALARGAV